MATIGDAAMITKVSFQPKANASPYLEKILINFFLSKFLHDKLNFDLRDRSRYLLHFEVCFPLRNLTKEFFLMGCIYK
jgi:hypothetical protein